MCLACTTLLCSAAFAATGSVTAPSGLRLRSGPSTDCSIITALPYGTLVSTGETENGWYAVSFGALSGWMCGDYIEITADESSDSLYPAPAPDPADAIIACAEQYFGCPYSWGATGPWSFDCSGLTQTVFAACGYSLDRTADQQMQQGVSVAFDELKPGDLVFFNMYGGSAASHVGVYIGGGEFIHASSSRGVCVSEFTSYYLNRYIGAQRIL